jgi:hypothetical protein
MYGNTNKKLVHGQKFYKPMKEERSDNKRVPTTGDERGHLMGSPSASKGTDRKMLVKHEGMIMGGSVTGKKPTTSAKSINKMPLEKRNIVGTD